MKYILTTYIILLSILSFPSQTTSINKNIGIKQYAIQKSELYEINPSVTLHIIERESSWNASATGDMHILCPTDYEPVEARGLVQITRCYFPEITDEQAYDPYFSIDFLTRKLSEDKCYLWSTCPLGLDEISRI